MQQILSRPRGERREDENRPDLPDENHHARVLRMKQPQAEIAQSSRGQSTERRRYVRRKRRAAAEHDGDSDRRHRPNENDRREAEPIRPQRQAAGPQLYPVLDAPFAEASQPDGEWQPRDKQNPAIIPWNSRSKGCGRRTNAGGERSELLD